jgi:hypothetical protein
MNAVYFIELKDGRRLYKADSFWSKTEDIKKAKIHNDSENDKQRFFESLVSSFKPWSENELTDESWEIYKKYEGGKYGYQTFTDDYALDLSTLSEPYYLTQIESILKSGDVVAPTIEAYKRDIKLNQILN